MNGQRKQWATIAAVLAGLAWSLTAGAQQAPAKAAGKPVRVGTFDSRAVAIAYYQSPRFKQRMEGLKAAYEQAKAAGDEKTVKAMEAASATPVWPDVGWPPSQAQQAMIEKQGFGTWPVDNVLVQIKDQLPEIAKQAGVDLIVSKWAIVQQQPGLEFVDVSAALIKAVNPEADAQKLVETCAKHPPAPLEKLDGKD